MIKVRFPQDMILYEAYTFYWEKVKDSRGLPLKDGSLHGLFAFEEEEETPDPEEPEEENPEPPAASFSAGDIRINEVMANPNGFIPNTEYVELYNTLDKPVQLTWDVACNMVTTSLLPWMRRPFKLMITLSCTGQGTRILTFLRTKSAPWISLPPNWPIRASSLHYIIKRKR